MNEGRSKLVDFPRGKEVLSSCLALALTALMGCDCGGTPTVECRTTSMCSGGRICVDMRCFAPSDAGSVPDAPPAPDASMCATSRVCGSACCASGETCTGGTTCCASTSLCGSDCCGADERCELGMCRLVCASGEEACGEGAGATCCDAGNVCLGGACVVPGAMCTPTMPCSAMEYCEPTLGRCLPRAMTEPCEVRPPPGTFDPTVEWRWTGDATVVPTHNQIMMTPAVASLTDDDGDGDIDGDDVPDVVFNTFAQTGQYYVNGVLRAVSGADGSRIFPTSNPPYRTMPGAGVAIAEVDASSPGPEVITCAERSGGVGCCDGDAGALLILSSSGNILRRMEDVNCGYSAPVVGDMNADGTPEIAVRYHVVHADGSTVFNVAGRDSTAVSAPGDLVTMADLDEDGQLELVGGNAAFRYDGTPLWSNPTVTDGYPAIADLDADGAPEVVVVAPGDHAIHAFHGRDGVRLWGPVDINQGRPTSAGPTGGGPPTIADFDGDGLPEIAAAGGYGYVVFEHDGTPKWFQTTQDISSRVTGSSVFDFDGDGAAEVVYNDELFLRVYDGTTGAVRLEQCNTTGTLWEYPLVVDVDADDRAEIIVIGNNYGGQRCRDGSMSQAGITVYGSGTNSWVRTRRVWPQHTYHVTDRDDAAGVPRNEARNWENPRLNNFRQNVQPDGIFDAPDLVPLDVQFDAVSCDAVRVRVANVGRAGVRAGVPVVLFDRDPTMMGSTPVATGMTTRRLLPGESEVILLRLARPIAPAMSVSFWVQINGGMMPLTTLSQCRVDNDTDRIEAYCPDVG